jgi:tRNA pseudouridine55 synthase
MDGLLVVDKPVGPTSHDVVMRVRRALGERRIGHTGTLDPAASGVLALVLGRATRLARFMAGDYKRYDAIVTLGVSTDTYDAEGKASGAPYEGPWPSAEMLDAALQGFRGSFLQRPPAYSAKKIAGRRSYDLARSQDKLDQAPTLPAAVMVSIAELTLTGYDGGVVKLTVEGSAGFYVRSLAHDLGERLGTGAHLSGLRRTRSGTATLVQSQTLASIEADPRSAIEAVVPMASMLQSMPAVMLTATGASRAMHGCSLGPADFVPGSGREGLASVSLDDELSPDDPGPPTAEPESDLSTQKVQPVEHVRLLSADGNLLGMAEAIVPSGILHPCVVLM